VEIIESGCDVAIVRVPSGRSQCINSLVKWALPLIHADTLVYYKCDLSSYVPKPLRNSDVVMRKADPSDMDSLRRLIAETFKDYVNHYHANALFSRNSILEGYQEWAESHLLSNGRTLWVADRDGDLVAFAACSEDDARQEGEIALNAVAPGQSGRGLYGDLVRHTQAVFRRRGFKLMKISTQVSNFAVQKVWAREGFFMFEAWDTFHISPLLSAGRIAYDREIVLNSEQVASFVEASGNLNAIDLNAEAGRIAHGVMAFAEITGTEVSGSGAILGHLHMAFFRPMVASNSYRLMLRVPGGLKEAGRMHAIAQVHDDAGRLCSLGHTELVLGT